MTPHSLYLFSPRTHHAGYMKTLLLRSILVLLALLQSGASIYAQLNLPSSLRDEVGQATLASSAREVVVLIHGWTGKTTIPAGYNRYNDLSDSPDLYYLTNILKQKFAGSTKKLVTYHWEEDATTGSVWNGFLFVDLLGYGNATEAAVNAYQHGLNLATLLHQQCPDLRTVHFIAHSAGSWAARRAAESLLQKNPYVAVQVTLLDPFIPDANFGFTTGLSTQEMSTLDSVQGADRLHRLENYYSDDLNAVPPTLSTQETFSWRTGIDVNLQVDWGAIYYSKHSGPIEFYADTVKASIQGEAVPVGLYGTGCPFDFLRVGWNLSRIAQASLLPNITSHPQPQSVSAGASPSFSVTASRANNYEWFKAGTLIASGTPMVLSNVQPSNGGDYVVRVSNASGLVFSEKATLQVSTPSTPTITSISPQVLNTQAAGQTQLITITGTNFTASSTLTFFDGNTTYSNRVPTFVPNSELRYNIGVGTTPGTWTVKVVNGSVESLPSTFYTVSTGAQLTGLSISGPAAVAENGSGSYSATALFSDGSTQSGVAANWSENSSATSISSSGQLSAGSVGSDTSVTVSASFTYNGVTKSASTGITVLNGGGGSGTTVTQVLSNGTFEAGDNPWGTPYGDADVVNLSYPRSGSWYAYIGNVNNAAGAFSQFFPIPASATAATLSFYLNVVTTETTTTTKFDNMEVSLATASDQYVGTVATFSNLDKGTNTNGVYTLKSYNIMPLLNAYKGQSLFLVFSGDTDSSNSTIFRVDDVSLQITTPNPVTLTSLSISGPSSILEGKLDAYYGQAVFSDGTTQQVSASNWSENSSATTIDGNGFLTAGQVAADTTVTLSASYTFSGVTRNATRQITVADSTPVVTFTSLAINGPGALNENSSQAYTATAIFSNGTTQSVSPSWSENSSKTSISSGGNLTAGEVANNTTVTVSASHTISGVTRNSSMDVLIVNSSVPPTLSSLSISGPNSVSENSTAQYSGTATFSDGSTQAVDPTWSETGAITSISAFGLLSAGDVTANVDVSVGASVTIGGVSRSASKTVTVTDTPDTTGPGLAITSPANNAVINVSSVTISGTAGDGGRGNNGISSVTVNGVAATGGSSSGATVANWSAQISLTAGVNTVTVIATDSFNNTTQRQMTLSFEPPDLQGPSLAIAQPIHGVTVNVTPITVSGTASDSGFGDHGIASVMVNGNAASNGTAAGTGTANWSAQVALNPGANTITVIANDTSTNNTGTQQQITVNYTPPGTVAFSAASYTVNEGDGTVVVQLARTGGTGGAVSVKATTADGTSLDGSDFTGGEQVVQFADGAAVASLSIPITNDAVFESAEAFTVALSAPTGGLVLGALTSATVTINDDDQPGTFSFASGNSQIGEGGGTHTVTVNRTGGSRGAVSVNYALGTPSSGRAALSPDDFTFSAGTLNFADNELSKSFQLTITQDVELEGNEVLLLVLSSPTGGASLGASTHLVTITDDDLVVTEAATYSGLINGDFAVSGYGGITLKTTIKGTLSGKLLVDGDTFRFSGRVSELGQLVQTFRVRSGRTIINPRLIVQLRNDGTFGGTWETGTGKTYSIAGEKNAVGTSQEPVAEVGRYTAHLRGEDITIAGGSVRGYLLLSVGSKGSSKFVGALPDGTKLSGGSNVSINGALPVVFGLYRENVGHLFGFAAISGDGASRVLAGDLRWSKPPQTKGVYASGIADAEIELAGHVWTPPLKGFRVVPDFNDDEGGMRIKLMFGNLLTPIDKTLLMTTGNAVSVTLSNTEKLSLRVSAKTGQFTGGFQHSDGRKRSIGGVFVQNHSGASNIEGFFAGNNVPGLVQIVPLADPSQTYSISVSAATGGSATGAASGVAQGSQVTVTAIPNSTHWFSAWTENGSTVSTNAAYTFNVAADRTLIAVFTQSKTIQPGPAVSKDIWTTSVYSYDPVNHSSPGGGKDDENLRVGGWGDLYYSLLQFDLSGLPSNPTSATLQLYCAAQFGGGTPMYLDRITQAWDWKTSGTGRDRLRLWWSDRPSAIQWIANELPTPSAGQWYEVDITDLYNAWKNGTQPNNGIQLRPKFNSSNNFNNFYSAEYLDDTSKRPKLILTK